MYTYAPGEVESAMALQTYDESRGLQARLAELEKQVAMLMDAVDTMAERLGIEA